MQRYISLYPLICVAFALPLAAATLEVRVATPSGTPVDEAVVYALPSQPMPVARKTSTMDQVNRTFVPHVLAIQTGSWVEFPNSDQILHQVFSNSPVRKFSTPLYVGKPARPVQFPASGVAEIGCTIHEQMNAYIVIVDTPFFATTTKSGTVSIPDVTAGDYAIRVWYPGMRTEPQPQKISVTGSERVPVSITTSK